jgi:DNA primase
MPGQRADVKEIKSRLDIVSVISRYLTLTKSGSGYKGKCPFHKDDTPSMTVSAEKGLWHCFGCGEGGDVIGFVMKIERISFLEAVRRLAEEVGMTIDTPEDGARDESFDIMAGVANAFVRNLRSKGGEKAREYLLNRGYPESCWLSYGLGYALPGWDHVKRAFAKHGEATLLKLGLLVQGDNGTYDRFRDRVIFPILDLSGRPVGFGGRAFDGEPKYLNSSQTPLFDKGRLMYGISWAREKMSQTRRAVLVEGYTDVLSLHQAGIRHAVGSMGTSLTHGQADLLKRFVDEVIIAYDQDAAGSAASLRGMHILRNAGLDVRVAELPAGEDPDGFVRSHGAEAMEGVLEDALPFHIFFVNKLTTQHDLSTVRGKEDFLGEAREFANVIQSEALFNETVSRVADVTDLSQEYVRKVLRSAPPPRLEGESPRTVEEHVTIEDDILSLVLRGDIPWDKLASLVSTEDFSEANRPIVRCLQDGKTDLKDIVVQLDEEGARRASLYVFAPRPIKAETALDEAVKWIARLPAIERRLPELDRKIRESADRADWERWDRLMKEKAELRAAWIRARDAARKGIHEQPSEEERSTNKNP